MNYSNKKMTNEKFCFNKHIDNLYRNLFYGKDLNKDIFLKHGKKYLFKYFLSKQSNKNKLAVKNGYYLKKFKNLNNNVNDKFIKNENNNYIYIYNLFNQSVVRWFKKICNDEFDVNFNIKKRNKKRNKTYSKRLKPTFHDNLMKWSNIKTK